MRMRLSIVIAVASMLVVAPAYAATDVVVSAAASLADVLHDLASLYQGRGGERAVINVAASNTLARQIRAGARVDVFISADEAQMDGVHDLIVSGTRVDLVSNQLAVVVPDDRPRSMSSPRALLDPGIRRIAIGDPAAVPAGVYAKRYLERFGIWPVLQSKVVPAASVRLALAAVESGAADAAIVYVTDVAIAHRVRVAYVVPLGDGPPIAYPAAVIRTGGNVEGGRRFLAFLQSEDAQRRFAHAGFRVAR